LNQYQAFLSQLANQSEPAKFEEAKLNPVWCKAMEEELQDLKKMIHGKLFHYQKIKNPWNANGYIK
jgi:hypothetical protein